MMKWIKQITLNACLLLAWPSMALAPLNIRVALVIGNSNYPQPATLLNPTNDAKGMAKVLRDHGFDVIELIDGNRSQMMQSIQTLKSKLDGKQGIGLLYYAGHGLQVDWRNYLVPIDAKLTQRQTIAEQTIDVGQIIDVFKTSATRTSIIVLDACRNNPFGESVTAGRGLAPLDAPSGTFLAFATAPGNVAEDGDTKSANGLYTQFLIKELKAQETKIEDVFKKVRFSVRHASEGRQIPWESTSLEEDFYFGKAPQKIIEPTEQEQLFQKEKLAWDTIKDTKKVSDIYDFLQKYPNSHLTGLAQLRLEGLQKAKIQALSKDGTLQRIGMDRFNSGEIYQFILKDGYTNLEKSRYARKIEILGTDQIAFVPPNIANAENTEYYQSGTFLIKNKNGQFDPPMQTAPTEFQIGHKWKSKSKLTMPNGNTETIEINGKVVGVEKITTPLGELNAHKVIMDQWITSGVMREFEMWYAPQYGFAVKVVIKTKHRNSRNAPDWEVRELIGRKG